MEEIFSGYVNVVDFGARPNSFMDDTEAFLNAIATRKSVYVPAGIYYVSKTLKIQNQNLLGSGFFQSQIVSINPNPVEPIIMAGRSCKIADLAIKYREDFITGNESAGERVGISTFGMDWPLQRGSSINNVLIAVVGTCLYSPDSSSGAPFAVEHSNLELLDFSYRAIDYGSNDRIGNLFSNIFIHSGMNNVDCMVRLRGRSFNSTLTNIFFQRTVCNTALRLEDASGFNLDSIHFESINVTGSNSAFVELKNSFGKIGNAGFSMSQPLSKDSALFRLWLSEDGNFGKQTENSIIPFVVDNLYVYNSTFKRANCKSIFPKNFNFIVANGSKNRKYQLDIRNMVFSVESEDRDICNQFPCKGNIELKQLGQIAVSGSSTERPKHRLCPHRSEYYDTDLGKKLVWDGEDWI